MIEPARLDDAQYQRLLAVRVGLRQFLRWSEERAEGLGLTSSQHQLLLAVRGHPDRHGPSVGDVATYLCIRHHSAVQLIDRAEHLGLVERVRPTGHDRRVVRLRLTATGQDKLALLTEIHLKELRRVGELIAALVSESSAPSHGAMPVDQAASLNPGRGSGSQCGSARCG